MNIGDRIRKLRKRENISQTELGREIGWSKYTLSDIELGKTRATTELIAKLSQFFKVSADYLIMGKEGKNEISEDEQEVVRAMRKDSEFKQIAVESARIKKKAIECWKNIGQDRLVA